MNIYPGRIVPLVILLAAARCAQADQPVNAELPAYTPEREAAAVAFVKEHHAELTDVLAGLKKSKSDEY